MRKLRVLGMILAAGLTVVTQAWAGPTVGSLLVEGPNFFQGGVNREYLIDRVLTAVGQLDVGDSVRGLFNVPALNTGSANLGGLTPNNELTGIFQMMIIA